MKLSVQLIFLLLIAPVLSSCTANYIRNTSISALETAYFLDSHQVKRSQSFVWHRSSKIYLQTLSYSEGSVNSANKIPLPKRQVTLERELYKNLQAAFPFTVQGEPGLSLADALLEASKVNTQYLVYPYVTSTRNQLNSVNEISEGRELNENRNYGPDHSTYTLVLFDVYSQRMLDTVQIHSHERWFASEKNLQEHLHMATLAAVKQLSSL